MTLSLPLLLWLFHTSTSKHLSWKLNKEYKGASFFDDWTFFVSEGWGSTRDPTNGFVNYTDENYAKESGYISYNSHTKSVYMGVDYQNEIPHYSGETGRDSVRIQTNDAFNEGSLFIIQATHMPQGCATWPSIWFLGNNATGNCPWPKCGEIDIVEGVNQMVENWLSMHTSEGCDFTGVDLNAKSMMGPTDCYTDYFSEPQHLGCTFACGNNSFGSAFNDKGGGVYAIEWSSDALSIWFWNMDDMPSDVQSMNPNTESWGTPVANWPWGPYCPSTHLSDLSLVIDTTFCGDWAGDERGIWNINDMGCGKETNDTICHHFVQYNPDAFENAYWDIDYIRVFTTVDESDKGSTFDSKWIIGIAVGVVVVGVIVMVIVCVKRRRHKVQDETQMTDVYMNMNKHSINS